MKLVSLKLKPKKKLRKSLEVASETPRYPYGTHITLDNDTIDKLGIDIENTKAGDAVYFTAVGKVESLSIRDEMVGKRKSISIQITSMGWGKP